MKIIPEKYLRLDILKECSDFRGVYKEINALITLFSDAREWENIEKEIHQILIAVLSEKEIVEQLAQSQSEEQKCVVEIHYAIMVCQLYQISSLYALGHEKIRKLFSVLLKSSKSMMAQESAASLYLLELQESIIDKQSMISEVDQNEIEEYANIMCNIRSINSIQQYDELSSSIIFKLLNSLLQSDSIQQLKSIFETVLQVYDTKWKNNRFRLLSQKIASCPQLSLSLSKMIVEILQNGSNRVDDKLFLKYTLEIAKMDYTQANSILVYLNSIISHKSNISHHIKDTKQLYLLFARLATKDNVSHFLFSITHLINSLTNRQMAVHRFYILKKLLKFIKKQQNYSLLKKAPFSMPPEKFKISNAVVKAESILLSLLEASSILTFEDKTKVIDMIQVNTFAFSILIFIYQVMATEKSESFSEFFYEEFFHMFKSEDPKDFPIQQYSQSCLGHIYYSLVSSLFCEDQIIDLRLLGDRLGKQKQIQAERAMDMHKLIIKGFIQQSLNLSKSRILSLLDLFSKLIYPCDQSECDGIQGIIGFISNTYEIFYDEEYFELQSISIHGIKLSDSIPMNEFMIKRLGGIWGSECEESSVKKSYLIMKGLSKIIKEMIKCRDVVEKVILSGQVSASQRVYFDQMNLSSDWTKNDRVNIKDANKMESEQIQSLAWETKNERSKILQSVQEYFNNNPLIAQVSTACFLTANLIHKLFTSFKYHYKEGNISTAESILYFLIVVRKAEISSQKHTSNSNESKLFMCQGEMISFFYDKYSEFQRLSIIYPGKLNLKLRELKLIDHYLHLLSMFKCQHHFPSNQDPEQIVTTLISDLKKFSTYSLRKVLSFIQDIDQICSDKKFHTLLNSAIHNLLNRPIERSLNISVILCHLQSLHQKIEGNQQSDLVEEYSTKQIDILNAVLLTLEKHLTEYTLWTSCSSISVHSQCTQILFKSAELSLSLCQYPKQQVRQFSSILLKAIISPKDLSQYLKGNDLISLKISAFETALDLITQNNQISQIIDGEIEQQLAMGIIILGTSDSDTQIQRCVFKRISKQAKQLPSIFMASMHLFSSSTDQTLKIVSSQLIRVISEKHQRCYFGLMKNDVYQSQQQRDENSNNNNSDLVEDGSSQINTFTNRVDYSLSLQYQIIYLMIIYLNHPSYLLVNSNWNFLLQNLSQNIDIFFSYKQQYPMCFSLLASIVARIQQAAIPINSLIPSNILKSMALNQQKQTFKVSNVTMIQELLIQRLSDPIQTAQDKYILLCDVILDFTVQKWMQFRREESLKTIQLEIPLPMYLYSIKGRQLRERDINCSKSIEKSEVATKLRTNSDSFDSHSSSPINQKKSKPVSENSSKINFKLSIIGMPPKKKFGEKENMIEFNENKNIALKNKGKQLLSRE